MTTNKPEVVAWSWDYRGQLMLTTAYSRALELAEPPYPTKVEPLIRLADYQRLQADHERLQAECEELRQQVETFQGLKPAMPPMPPTGEGLPRYGLRWNGPSQPLSVPMDDGYWTPWHLAQGECEKLRKDAEFGRSILAKREPGKAYGCHCDLEEGMEPDSCVIDSGERNHCVYAKSIEVKEQCEYWRVIAKDSAIQEANP